MLVCSGNRLETRWWNYSSHFKAAAFGLVISDSFYLRVQLASDAFAKGSLLWRERLSFRRQEAMS